MKRTICPVCKCDVALTTAGYIYKHGQSPKEPSQPMCAGAGRTVEQAAEYVLSVRGDASAD